MSQKPPGSFGWFGGASHSSRFGSDPAGYVAHKADKHGDVFCDKIASYPSVFAAGHRRTSEMLSNPVAFPTNESLLKLVGKAVGPPFFLEQSEKRVEFWRDVVDKALYGEKKSDDAAELADAAGESLALLRHVGCRVLLPELRDEVSAVVKAGVSRWVQDAANKGVGNLYDSAKKLANELVMKVFLGLTMDEADKLGIPELQTLQFRGCEAMPLEVGFPLLTSTYEAGVSARDKLVAIVAQHMKTCREEKKSCAFLKAAARVAVGETYKSLAEVVVMLFHGMVVKALAAGLFYVWLELTRAKPGVVAEITASMPGRTAFVIESLRLHTPVAVMARGVKCPAFAGFALNAADHGEWKAFACLAAANTDKKVYANPKTFNHKRWLPGQGAELPPKPLTFGVEPRSCLGSGLTLALIMEATNAVFAAGLVPVVHAGLNVPEKTLPVKRPVDPVQCTFRKNA
ncbi:hypothetical protein DIPPA_18728 [Diplonema papillatum]|nr:hypothetical protein DIPPA_18728 [Diplonema papillatum]|eukprot:gene14620-22360_t